MRKLYQWIIGSAIAAVLHFSALEVFGCGGPFTCGWIPIRWIFGG